MPCECGHPAGCGSPWSGESRGLPLYQWLNIFILNNCLQHWVKGQDREQNSLEKSPDRLTPFTPESRAHGTTLLPLLLLTLKNPRNFFFSLSVSSLPRDDFLNISGEEGGKKKKVVFVSIWSMRLSTSLLKAFAESFNLLVLRRKSSRFHSKPSVLPQSPLVHRKSHGVLTQVFSTKAALSLRVARCLWKDEKKQIHGSSVAMLFKRRLMQTVSFYIGQQLHLKSLTMILPNQNITILPQLMWMWLIFCTCFGTESANAVFNQDWQLFFYFGLTAEVLRARDGLLLLK